MADQQNQVQRAFEKLTQACPKDWALAQQEVLIEDFTAEAKELRASAEKEKKRADAAEAKVTEIQGTLAQVDAEAKRAAKEKPGPSKSSPASGVSGNNRKASANNSVEADAAGGQ